MNRLGIYTRSFTAIQKIKKATLFLLAFVIATSSFLYFTKPSISFAADTVQSSNLPFMPSAIAASQDGTHIVLAQNNTMTQFYVSDNSGVDWTPVSVPASTSAGPQQMVSTPDGQNLFGVYGSRYYSSSDGGLNWTTSTGHNDHAFYNSMAYASGTGVIYAVDWKNGPHQIVSSNDFGQTWSVIYTATNDVDSVSSNSDGTKLYDTENNETDGSNTANVSTDGGVTWSVIHQGDATTADDSIYSNSDSSVLVLSQYSFTDNAEAAPLISIDGGTTWRSSAGPPNGQYLYFTGSSAYSYNDADTGTTLYHVTVDTGGTSPVQPTVGTNGQSLENNPTISSQPTFSGVAKPFAQVTVTVHSDPITCTTTADSSGAWSCQLPQALPAGSHTVLIDFVNQDASTDQLGPYTVTVPSATTTNTTSNNALTSKKTTPSMAIAADPTIAVANTDQSPTVTDTIPTSTTNNTTDTQTSETNSFNWWWVLVPAIFVAVIVTLVMIARRKR